MNVTFSMVDDRLQDVLAANLRRLRIARHLSLSELARATTMSKATLSGIENGRANPTVDTLASLAAALRVTVVELLDEPPLGELRVVRAAAGAPHRLLEAGAGFDLAEIALGPRAVQERAPQPAGARASVYVLEGKLVAGPVERTTELDPGDYLAFPADVPHAFEALRSPARALLLTRAVGT